MSEALRSSVRLAVIRNHPLEFERTQHSLNHHSSLFWPGRASQREENAMDHIRTIFSQLKECAVWRMTGRGGLKKSIIKNAIAMTLAPLMSLTFALQSQNARAEAEKPGGVFYRFTTKFIHDGDEELVFDTVVACSVRVTGGALTGRSYLGGLNPNVFAQRTRGNHAVMVTSPRICSWANRGLLHELRKNYLPIVVWFEDADDLSRGEALVSMDAYEAPGSPLKFVSSKIGPADYDDWIANRNSEPKNIVDPALLRPNLLGSGEALKRYRAFDPKNPKPNFVVISCRGYARLKIAEKDRAKIRAFWPDHRPKYWIPKGGNGAKDFNRVVRNVVGFIGTVPGAKKLGDFWFGTGGSNFAVSSRDGQSGTEYREDPKYKSFPAEYYPMLRDDRFPYLTPEVGRGAEYTWDVRAGIGRLGCSSAMPGGKDYWLHYYDTDEFSGSVKPIKVKVDGVNVFTTDIERTRVRFFVENDTHLFAITMVGIQSNGGVD